MKKPKAIVLVTALIAQAFLAWWISRSDFASAQSQPSSATPPQSRQQQPENKSENFLKVPGPKIEDQSGRPGVKSRDFTASIAGVDANNNGVRDDIEDYINRTYPDPNQRAALMQNAQADVALLTVNTEDLNKVAEAATMLDRSLDCSRKFFSSEDLYNNATREILAMHMNTEVRFRAYAKIMSLGGYVVHGAEPNDEPCNWPQNGTRK